MQQADCQAALKRVLEAGPPLYVKDAHGLPLEDGETHVCALWFQTDKLERSSRLEGAPADDAARQTQWDELREVYGAMLADEPPAAAEGAAAPS